MPRLEQPSGLQGAAARVRRAGRSSASTLIAVHGGRRASPSAAGSGRRAQRGAAIVALARGQRRALPHGVRAADPAAAADPRPAARRRAGGRRRARAAVARGLVRRPRITDASAIYGTFALVIGLLSWFLLVAHLLLIAAEVNVVLRWRLWPRSLDRRARAGRPARAQRFAEATRMDRARADRGRLRRRRGRYAGTTAVASISTFALGSSRPATAHDRIAGK